ncbi:metal-dependent hydrolase [Halobacteria archaeon AArc-m2/3/4]|uniref:Metal-dependent hydrolase n=1 Tax=Natronoglomus mannanivorans TaxID=2979990 RepID=A0ABT2QKG2_9EURY|nr:metal-dependent hydrolase [Halobacteria archaeon AArc-m2/3/4]
MPDLLTHVIVGYIVGTLLSMRYVWMKPAHVTLVMIGALSPDFAKIQLVVPDGVAASILGVPFSWSPLHTVGGTVLVLCLGTLFFAPEYRMRALVLLAIGAGSHHVLDVLLLTPTGYAYAVFWPLTEYRPPSGGLYVSTDRWPAVVAGISALFVWAIAHYRDEPTATE